MWQADSNCLAGIDLLSQLRQRGVSVPVVFLTSHVQQANEKLAFERGAVDFIDKSRGVEILASRLRLVSETGKPTADFQADKMVACGKLVLRPGAAEHIGTEWTSASPSVNTKSSN